MQYYERLKAARQDKDIKQETAANVLKTTKQQISKYENGQQQMTVEKLKQLCLLYHVSADYILGLPPGLDWPRK